MTQDQPMITPEQAFPLINPARFRTALEKTLDGLFELAELTATPAEREYPCWFQLSEDRPWPLEWLQSLQDLLQVMQEPRLLGSLFLNSNPSFILDAIPGNPFSFHLGYFSLTSEPEESPQAFWERAVLPLLEMRYPQWQQQSMLLAVCRAPERTGMDCLDFADMMEIDLGVDDVANILNAAAAGEAPPPRRVRMLGTACDALLGARTRLSGWLLG